MARKRTNLAENAIVPFDMKDIQREVAMKIGLGNKHIYLRTVNIQM